MPKPTIYCARGGTSTRSLLHPCPCSLFLSVEGGGDGRLDQKGRAREGEDAMALIRRFLPYAHERTRVHGEVECGYTHFEAHGRRYLQLDTYGSQARRIPGKTSQTIQLDIDGARRLMNILVDVFPDLR
jgi:hypothetical protein